MPSIRKLILQYIYRVMGSGEVERSEGAEGEGRGGEGGGEALQGGVRVAVGGGKSLLFQPTRLSRSLPKRGSASYSVI